MVQKKNLCKNDACLYSRIKAFWNMTLHYIPKEQNPIFFDIVAVSCSYKQLATAEIWILKNFNIGGVPKS
jgi:hypothetical protein